MTFLRINAIDTFDNKTMLVCTGDEITNDRKYSHVIIDGKSYSLDSYCLKNSIDNILYGIFIIDGVHSIRTGEASCY